MTIVQQAYNDGFVKQCAARGVDPELLCKSAGSDTSSFLPANDIYQSTVQHDMTRGAGLGGLLGGGLGGAAGLSAGISPLANMVSKARGGSKAGMLAAALKGILAMLGMGALGTASGAVPGAIMGGGVGAGVGAFRADILGDRARRNSGKAISGK